VTSNRYCRFIYLIIVSSYWRLKRAHLQSSPCEMAYPSPSPFKSTFLIDESRTRRTHLNDSLQVRDATKEERSFTQARSRVTHHCPKGRSYNLPPQLRYLHDRADTTPQTTFAISSAISYRVLVGLSDQDSALLAGGALMSYLLPSRTCRVSQLFHPELACRVHEIY
jgi:hypothetical protein